jgi:hypothetical protein
MLLVVLNSEAINEITSPVSAGSDLFVAQAADCWHCTSNLQADVHRLSFKKPDLDVLDAPLYKPVSNLQVIS